MPHQCPCTGTTHNYTNKQVSQWQRSMREFWENRKEECKGGTPVAAPSTRTVKDFLTGSSYEGGYEDMNMRGYGEYIFPNGVLYRGEFESGMCHGDGELIYETGSEEFTVIRGKWNKGILKDSQIYFNGILEYNKDDWRYCKMPDRRYAMEFNKNLQPAGKSNITPEQPPRKISPGFQDSGYGFYSPKTKSVYKYHDVLQVLKAPSDREQKWIESHCRMEPTRKIGPRPDLYETWLGPDVSPPPLPSLLVGFTAMNQGSSMFRSDVDTDDALFYDTTIWNFSRFERN